MLNWKLDQIQIEVGGAKQAQNLVVYRLITLTLNPYKPTYTKLGSQILDWLEAISKHHHTTSKGN